MPLPSTAKLKHDLAYRQGVQRTIPTSRATIAVTGTSATADLTAYKGKWIWLKAKTLDITILRQSATLTAGNGLVLATADPYFECYVDPDGEPTLSHISTGSATLEVLYDAE